MCHVERVGERLHQIMQGRCQRNIIPRSGERYELRAD